MAESIDTTDTEIEEFETVEDQSEDTQPEVQMVRIRYAGSTYEVPEHLADVWAKREEEFQRKLSEQGRELGQLRQQTQVPSPVQTRPEPPQEDEDLAFFQSPSETIKRREAALRESLREEFRQEQAILVQRQQYWSQFYTENPDLRGREKLVNAVVSQEYENLKDLPPNESRVRLAEAIASLLGTKKPDAEDSVPLTRKPVQAERPGNPPAPRKPAPPAKDITLSEELRMRSEARRRAQFNTKE